MTDNINSTSIIHIVSSLEVGGAERFVIDLCQVQRSSGAQVAILSFGKPSDALVTECDNKHIQVFHTENGRFGKWRCALSAMKGFKVIHFHSPYPLKFLLPVLPLCLFKQVVYTRHGADPLAGSAWRWVHRIAQIFVNQVSFVSQEGAEVFERSHGWKDKKKHVIDNGVNLSEVQIKRSSSSVFRLGSVGRMVALKNQISLLKALLLLNDEIRTNIEVHFFGNGDSLEQLTAFADAHDLNQQVSFHGMVNDRDTIYNTFDTLVVTSETEGLSLAIIEAMAYRCSVIASNVGGNPKLVEDNKNGFLFEYNDTVALAKLITTLYDDLLLRESYAEYSRQKVERHFSLSACAKKYSLLYKASKGEL